MLKNLSPFEEVVTGICESLGDPGSLAVAILVRNGEWEQLAALRRDPNSYMSALDYFLRAISSSLLRKAGDLPIKTDLRRRKAIETFLAGETSCYHANERLGPYADDDRLSEAYDPRIGRFFALVRKIVLSWIGHGPRPDAGFAVFDSSTERQRRRYGRFGPRGTFTDTRGNVTLPHKMTSDLSFTTRAQGLLPAWAVTSWAASWAAAGSDIIEVKGNRHAVAPKDATTDRLIGSEPSLNVFHQLELGSQLRYLAAKAGIDLDHGADTHKVFAQRYSNLVKRLEVDDGATMDLKNASGSISYELVRLCFPRAWFDAMCDLRSPMSLLLEDSKEVLDTARPSSAQPLSGGRRWMRLEQFSSMGCGFTFELESILFAAIASAAMTEMGVEPILLGRRKNLSVFGDDILLPDSVVEGVTACYQFCGFQINEKKSFRGLSPFKESCGADYFAGADVRPVFFDGQPSTPADWIVVVNGIFRLQRRLNALGAGISLEHVRSYALDQIPEHVRRCRGPEALGDVCINSEEAWWKIKWRDGIRYVLCYSASEHRRVLYSDFPAETVLACATYGGSWGNGGVNLPDSVLSWQVEWVPYS